MKKDCIFGWVPQTLFLTKGVGHHKEKLASFEEALRDAGIAQFNLVQVSSILPPHCKVVPRKKGLEKLSPGQIVMCVMSRNETNEKGRLLSAACGLAIPADRKSHGYISEHHAFGWAAEETGDYAEDLAASMLATTLGVDFDPEVNWDEKREIFRMSGKIVRTRNICRAARAKKGNIWTSVVSAAVFVS